MSREDGHTLAIKLRLMIGGVVLLIVGGVLLGIKGFHPYYLVLMIVGLVILGYGLIRP